MKHELSDINPQKMDSQKWNLLLDLLEHPEKYSETQKDELLGDEEVNELYQQLIETRQSLDFAKSKEKMKMPSIDAEWEKLKEEKQQKEVMKQNAETQHTAKLLLLLKNGDTVPHQAQIIRTGKAARAAADDGNALAGRFRAFRIRNVARMIDRVALEAANVDGRINHIAAAARLARMLADEATGSRERIILADELNSIGITASANESDVRVAIIGGGPSGMSAAYYLELMGHHAVVFEEKSKLGGMLRYGIPAYRFPRERLQEDLDAILSPAKTILAASKPMAQSALLATFCAVLSIKSRVCMSALPASTSSMRFCSCARPTRQGTHLPQVCAWQTLRNDSCRSTGHSPGGLAMMCRSRSLYKRSTVSWAWSGVSILKRLIIFLQKAYTKYIKV